MLNLSPPPRIPRSLMYVSPDKKECAEKDGSGRTRIRSARSAQGRVITPFFETPKSLLQGAHPLKPPGRPGPVPSSEPNRCPRPAHLALACRGGAPDVGAALRAPVLSRHPWARRGPAQPGQGPERRAGRVAAAAVVVAATAGSARSGRSARTAVGHARSRRASQPAARRARLAALAGLSVRRPASGVRVGRGSAEPAGPPREPRVTGPGRRAGLPAGMRSCRAKKPLTSPAANQSGPLGGR